MNIKENGVANNPVAMLLEGVTNEELKARV